ncbi:mitochondrial nucleotide exchange factor MGE1 [Rhodotorula paludigena]|uniref:mitochondrial nucleotide exchange factor MGE1 n=1 Tax=Rhodotorula paludigena TaxID=86838 RepID=UPI00316C3825
MLRSATASLRASLRAPQPALAAARAPPQAFLAARRAYSAQPAATPETQEPQAAADASAAQGAQPAADATKATDELHKALEEQKKLVAEFKDARLRTLADFENLQKRSVVEKQQAKDFALQSFAKDLISEIDVLHLALKSIPAERVTEAANADLTGLYEGVKLLKRGIEKVLERHGVVAFDPTGEPFDPNRHEALYQAPVPGKEPGSVLECQEIGYMIKERLLRPAKVGVVLSQE